MLRTPITILSSGKPWQWNWRWQWKHVSRQNAAAGGAAVATAAFSAAVLSLRESSRPQQILSLSSHDDSAAEEEEVFNWSGTHSVIAKQVLRPGSTAEVEDIIREAHTSEQRIRVFGNALSPNGIGLSDGGTMLSMVCCDKVLQINPMSRQVRVQAGARVEQVLKAIAPYGLTLENLASIGEQQIGGVLQVGAHGSGATIPPIDEQITSMRIVTPALGTLELSEMSNRKLFRMAKVSLGMFGVVTEVTIQCVPRHKLLERTAVLSREEVRSRHSRLLKRYKHLRYMWIPYVDAVVVVACNPVHVREEVSQEEKYQSTDPYAHDPDLESGKFNIEKRTKKNVVQPFLDLLQENGGYHGEKNEEEITSASLGFSELRDHLIGQLPLDTSWIRRVNAAEAEYWKRASGRRMDYSDRILGFECGGAQWVNEVCFPVKWDSLTDIDYVMNALQIIESCELPAPSPIEQRWTSSSTANMSPAYSEDDPTALYSWVGIIMYLPTTDPDQTKRITEAFFKYRDVCKVALWDKYGCTEHWAKIQKPKDKLETADVQERIRNQYPIADFNAARCMLDPKNILTNQHLEILFSPPSSPTPTDSSPE